LRPCRDPTAAKNPDGSVAVVILNQDSEAKKISLNPGEKIATITVTGQAIQTIF
jgi:glucosylceramidase